MRIPPRHFTKAALSLYGVMLVLAAAPADAALSLSDTPLFLTVSVPPNITLTLDDSGSMKRAWVPENCEDTGDILGCTDLNNRYEKAASRNLIYYNPSVAYPAAKKADGTSLTTTFTAAYRNGFDTAFGTVNLSTSYRPTASLDLNSTATEVYMAHYATDFKCSTTTPRMCQYKNTAGTFISTTTACVGNNTTERNASCTGPFDRNGNGNATDDGAPAPVPAYYYVYDKTLNAACTAGTAFTNNACYAIKYVTSTSGPGGTDERQNFANWYSFARTRNLATATAASLGFADLAPTARVAWQALNSCRGSTSSLVDTDCDGWKNNFTNISNAIKPFTGQHKKDFYTWLSQLPTDGSTPLPEAAVRAGEYYKKTGENGPYDNDFDTSNSGEHACRRNYHIMMTDGIWNNAVTTGNQDGSNIVLPEVATEPNPDITQYAPIAPYKDTYQNTLADVAFKYWISDLRNDLTDNLAPLYNDRVGTATQWFWNPRNDPATWQHMVNYTIGLGLSGYLSQTSPALNWQGNTYAGSYSSLVSGATAWPKPDADGSPANVADLWHAAIDSRGQFFSADNPAALSAAFQSVLTAIAGDAGSSAALSTNSTSIQPGTTVVYQAKFNRDWSGALLALPIDATGAVGSQLWDASKLIPGASSRKIFSYNGSLGVQFTACSNLSAAQQTALSTNSSGVVDGLCADRLQWLRGSAAKEQRNGGTFRNRPSSVMGDVINSDPGYVKNIDYGYTGLPAATPGQASYAAYMTGAATRTAMVYVGSNDGRVYGIRGDQGDAQSGVEQFSYIPAGVYGNLSRLTDPAYAHRYYADGAITVNDAYLGGRWKSVLVAGLNAGGKSIYALDVTDPAAFDETKVMWEFTGAQAGLSFSQPQIGILQNGQWVAVFGNGYNSTNGGAYLYVVDLRTGALLKEIKAVDAAGDDGNGLSTPLLYDSDGDLRMDTVYAGDLQGNMWKFDLSGATSTNWGVAYGGAPLFIARNSRGEVQAITAQPKAGGHPLGGAMVLFGTGKYLTAADVFDTTVQSFYGIWDHGAAVTTTNRSQLQVQRIDLQTGAFGREVRSITDNKPDYGVQKGWYLDLTDPPNPPGTPVGERVISTSLIKFGRVIFVTVVPSVDACVPGGTSWLMELDLVSGSTFPESILDLNNDKRFDQLDTVHSEVVSGVRTSSLGISKTPVWLDSGDPQKPFAYKVMTGTSGGFVTERNTTPSGAAPTPGTVTRRSWIQIR